MSIFASVGSFLEVKNGSKACVFGVHIGGELRRATSCNCVQLRASGKIHRSVQFRATSCNLLHTPKISVGEKYSVNGKDLEKFRVFRRFFGVKNGTFMKMASKTRGFFQILKFLFFECVVKLLKIPKMQ